MTIRNNYRITLYNTQFFTELITYKFPILPAIGDMIEVINQRTLFIVQSRSFYPPLRGWPDRCDAAWRI